MEKKSEKKLVTNRVIIAEGEKTGHMHVATGAGAVLDEDTLQLPEGGELTHDEHKQVTVAPGEYTRSIVNEYDHFKEEATKVED